MESISIRYCFTSADGTNNFFDLQIDGQSLSLKDTPPETLPSWAKLDFQQCPHCPLGSDQHPYCHVAANLVPIVERFEDLVSYDVVRVEAITEERTISHETTTQQALGSLMGLVVATSDCPYAAFFKPMARFHLPFASEEETIFRAASTYLLAQYFITKDNRSPDFSLNGLRDIYKNMQLVNFTMGERLRAATKTDSSMNALILLDTYAKALPFVINESLDEIRYLFEPFLQNFVSKNGNDE